MRFEFIRKGQRQIITGFVALLLLVGIPTGARAVLVDLDGSGSNVGALNIGSFDWNATSFLAEGGTSAIGAFVTSGGACAGTSCQFTVLSQGSLQGVNDINGSALFVNNLNNTYEITYVAKFTEVVTAASVATGTASFSSVPSAGVTLEIYFSPKNSSQINGSNFNDGTLILTASTISNTSGNFTVQSSTGVALDQSPNGNQYGTQLTVTGFGTTGIYSLGGLVTDPTFFVGALATLGFQFSNLSISLPFNSTDPMVCFDQTAASIAVGSTVAAGTPLDCARAVQVNGQPYSGQGGILLDGGYLPVPGATNGLFGSGPDFIAQTDPNSPLVAAVPEPASMLIFGFGLLGMGGYLRKRNRKAE